MGNQRRANQNDEGRQRNREDGSKKQNGGRDQYDERGQDRRRDKDKPKHDFGNDRHKGPMDNEYDDYGDYDKMTWFDDENDTTSWYGGNGGDDIPWWIEDDSEMDDYDMDDYDDMKDEFNSHMSSALKPGKNSAYEMMNNINLAIGCGDKESNKRGKDEKGNNKKG